MNRPYTAHSPYSLSPTERISTFVDEPPSDDLGYGADYDADYDEYADFEDYDEARIDRRWMWVAGVAGAILFIAVATTGVILGGGDSGSVSATATSAAPTTTAPVTTSAPPAATTPPAPAVPSLPPETVTTVSPTAEATAEPTEAAPPPAPSPRTVTYRVTGNRQLIDLVTVIYTDQQGALQTDVNVALPWSKTVVLDPGVELSSVTATSMMGQLNCSITDASGALIAAQNANSMIATCTK
ncbi:MAG TPA: MmpS family transport accessory protein [Mycobacterium sp.]|nr:MmpS family transport accessory protein [Mycobacterium sp.]